MRDTCPEIDRLGVSIQGLRSRKTPKPWLVLFLLFLVLAGCSRQSSHTGPWIEFTKVPHAGEGGPDKLDFIEGRAMGARPGQQIVIYARWGPWWVQPLVDRPFTKIQDSRWISPTHFGTEYAALLVEADYHPQAIRDLLPALGEGVAVIAVTKGRPEFWRTWWFLLSVGLGFALAVLAYFRFRMWRLTRQMNLLFEERLAERTRIAQELHDTLLQGFLSASMQLHVANDHLAADSAAKPLVGRVLEMMERVIEEGRNAVRGLRLSHREADGLEQAFQRLQGELGATSGAAFRIIAEGAPRPLRPIIRDEVYRIGREAVVNAFRHAGAKDIEVEVEYAANQLRLVVRDDGSGIDPRVLQTGRDGHWGLSGMRERAERIGGKLRVLSRVSAGTEVELSVPGYVAFESVDLRRRRT